MMDSKATVLKHLERFQSCYEVHQLLRDAKHFSKLEWIVPVYKSVHFNRKISWVFDGASTPSRIASVCWTGASIRSNELSGFDFNHSVSSSSSSSGIWLTDSHHRPGSMCIVKQPIDPILVVDLHIDLKRIPEEYLQWIRKGAFTTSQVRLYFWPQLELTCMEWMVDQIELGSLSSGDIHIVYKPCEYHHIDSPQRLSMNYYDTLSLDNVQQKLFLMQKYIPSERLWTIFQTLTRTLQDLMSADFHIRGYVMYRAGQHREVDTPVSWIGLKFTKMKMVAHRYAIPTQKKDITMEEIALSLLTRSVAGLFNLGFLDLSTPRKRLENLMKSLGLVFSIPRTNTTMKRIFLFVRGHYTLIPPADIHTKQQGVYTIHIPLQPPRTNRQRTDMSPSRGGGGDQVSKRRKTEAHMETTQLDPIWNVLIHAGSLFVDQQSMGRLRCVCKQLQTLASHGSLVCYTDQPGRWNWNHAKLNPWQFLLAHLEYKSDPMPIERLHPIVQSIVLSDVQEPTRVSLMEEEKRLFPSEEMHIRFSAWHCTKDRILNSVYTMDSKTGCLKLPDGTDEEEEETDESTEDSEIEEAKQETRAIKIPTVFCHSPISEITIEFPSRNPFAQALFFKYFEKKTEIKLVLDRSDGKCQLESGTLECTKDSMILSFALTQTYGLGTKRDFKKHPSTVFHSPSMMMSDALTLNYSKLFTCIQKTIHVIQTSGITIDLLNPQTQLAATCELPEEGLLGQLRSETFYICLGLQPQFHQDHHVVTTTLSSRGYHSLSALHLGCVLEHDNGMASLLRSGDFNQRDVFSRFRIFIFPKETVLWEMEHGLDVQFLVTHHLTPPSDETKRALDSRPALIDWHDEFQPIRVFGMSLALLESVSYE